ncbi:MAG: NADP-dependent oxidoreductase [Ancrocorticia sp.]
MSIAIVQSEFGGPEVLTPVHVPTPSADDLGADEVLVRVAAAGVNPIDVTTRSGGGMAGRTINVPYVPGWDLAGTVAAVGSDVNDLHPGQRVMGMARFPQAGNAYSQYTVVPAADLVPTPSHLSNEQAGALPLAAMTAWQAFADTTRVGAGDRVLITGAGGGVGHLAIQIAHHLGATVIAIASASKHEWLRELGADVTIDYRDADAVAALAADPVDVAFSLAAGSHAVAVNTVRKGGLLIALGAGAAGVADAAEKAGIRFASTAVHTQREWLTAVVDLAARGMLTPTVSQVFDLTDAASAHRAIEDGHATGKIVLDASGE